MKYLYLLHIFVPIIAAGIINLVIYLQGWNREEQDKEKKQYNDKLPPGYVIAIVWTILLGLLGYAHYLTYPSFASWIIVLAIIYCLLYPFLVINPAIKGVSENLLNFLALIFALVVCVLSYIQKNFTIFFTIPFVVWTLYVNIVTTMV